MKKYIKHLFAGFLLIGFTMPALAQSADEIFRAVGSPENPKVEISFNRYYTAEGHATLTKKIADAYPNLVRRISIGKSYEGRDMWMLQITNFQKGEANRKPGFYIDGNIHSNEIQGSEISIYTAWYLTEQYGHVDYITQMLDERIFYIVPTINPDARNNYMKEPNNGSTPRSGMIGLDDDRDGLIDEDKPDDLDGDGSITSMRRKNPYGNFIADPKDPRRMIQIGPDDKIDPSTTRYEMLGAEGIDNDGDGRVNEDRVGYYDPNRDWAWKWQPDYIQGGAYKYPFSVPENRNVADFVLAHPNIAGAQSYHNSGGMILRGPGAEEDVSTYNRADLRIYDAIGQKGEQIMPGYRYLTVYKDLYSVFGGELDWLYGSRGIYTFTNEIFARFAYYKNNEGGQNLSYRVDDELLFGDAWKAWTTYDHPTYGEIEIGGFKKNFGRATPGFMLEEELHRNMAFTLYHAYHMPRLSIDNVKEKDLGGGLREITAIIKNDRLMPTHASQDLKFKIERPDYIMIDGVDVQAGMIVQDEDRNVTVEQKVRPEKLEVANIPGMSVVKVRWIVSGRGTPKITVDSAKGGLISQ
jgi:hypothetical protein